MKTLLFILISAASFGQSTSYPTIYIWRVQQDTICTGDSLKIDYKPGGLTGQWVTDTVNIQVQDQEYHIFLVAKVDYNTLLNRPKEAWPGITAMGTDSCNYINIKIPSQFDFPAGWNGIGKSKYGQGKVVSGICETTSGNMIFNYKNCSIDTAGTVTGIQTYSLPGQVTIYYDMQGNRIEKSYNELIIEQVGYIRKKVIYLK